MDILSALMLWTAANIGTVIAAFLLGALISFLLATTIWAVALFD